MGGTQQSRRVLVVDDDLSISQLIVRRLTRDGMIVEAAFDARTVLEQLAGGGCDWEVVLLDVGLPGMSGVDLLRVFRERTPLASVVMLTGDDSAATATACMRAGAYHYLTKPVDSAELAVVVEKAARHSTVRRRMQQQPATKAETSIIGDSPATKDLRARLDQIARQDASVLVRGESGTGKEVIARAIHEKSKRADKPFVAVNCGAIPETLIDSELFGHAKGSFTGAMAERTGLFAEADGGTLFLDEIGDMPMPVQARLLRALQEKEIRPVGSNTVRKVDVRVIAATHVDLQSAIESGRFRSDLFYRLDVLAIHLLPLRERRQDIPLLAAHFLRKHGGIGAPSLTPDALDALVAAPWNGNVRELENALLHALAFEHCGEIGVEALPRNILTRALGTGEIRKLRPDTLLPLATAKRLSTERFERDYLIKVLQRASGSISEAARLAGIDRTNLRRLLKRHSIDADAFRSRE